MIDTKFWCMCEFTNIMEIHSTLQKSKAYSSSFYPRFNCDKHTNV